MPEKSSPVDVEKNITPKTSYLRHRPSMHTTHTSELKNVLAYSLCRRQRRASALLPPPPSWPPPPPRCHRHAATATLPLPTPQSRCQRRQRHALAKLPPPLPRCLRRQCRALAKLLPAPPSWPLPPHCHRASAATTVPFVSIVIILAVIVTVYVLLVDC